MTLRTPTECVGTSMLPEVLRAADVARALGVERSTILRRSWRAKFGLPGRMVCREWFVPRGTFLQWLTP